MRLVCIAVLTLSSVSALAADPADDDKTMQGAWAPVAAEMGGQPMPPVVLKTIALKIDNGKYEVTVTGENKTDKGTYALDTASRPRALTITGVEGPNAGKTFPCIYEFDGDKLRVCYDLSGAKRPTEFKTVAGTLLYLVTYERKK